jgi:hypothetical protein
MQLHCKMPLAVCIVHHFRTILWGDICRKIGLSIVHMETVEGKFKILNVSQKDKETDNTEIFGLKNVLRIE